jgi:hypothetical protein
MLRVSGILSFNFQGQQHSLKFLKTVQEPGLLKYSIPYYKVDKTTQNSSKQVSVKARISSVEFINHYSSTETRLRIYLLYGNTVPYPTSEKEMGVSLIVQPLILKNDAIEPFAKKLKETTDDVKKVGLFSSALWISQELFHESSSLQKQQLQSSLSPGEKKGSIFVMLTELFGLQQNQNILSLGHLSSTIQKLKHMKDPKTLLQIIYGVIHYLDEFIHLLLPYILQMEATKKVYGDIQVDFPDVNVLAKVMSKEIGIGISGDPSDLLNTNFLMQKIMEILPTIPGIMGLLGGFLNLLFLEILQ